jgi:hypothetical protein
MIQEASNQLIDKIKVILKGIDQTEIESEDGWWETSTGAKFGAEALKQILELLAQTQEPVAVYGYCPECGAKGVMRERRPNGNDKCANGHTYPSSTSTPPQRTERHELQAKGEHPAPCARHCEATAFRIVIKNLKAQLAQTQEPVSLPDSMTPEMLKKVQMFSELGSYAAENWANAYDVFHEFWRVAVSALPKSSQFKPEHQVFVKWASNVGHDTAYAISDTGEFLALNEITADLWQCWKAARA